MSLPKYTLIMNYILEHMGPYSGKLLSQRMRKTQRYLLQITNKKDHFNLKTLWQKYITVYNKKQNNKTYIKINIKQLNQSTTTQYD